MGTVNVMAEQGARASAAPDTGRAALRIARLPGLYGPVLRLSGTLDRSTAPEFRHQALLLAPLRHRAVLLNLTDLEAMDSDGLAVLVDSCWGWLREGVHPVLVAGAGPAQHLLSTFGIDRLILIVPDERSAVRVLEAALGAHAWEERSWREAEIASLAWWQALARDMDRIPLLQVGQRVSSMHPLCQKCEDTQHGLSGPGADRCLRCPLFHALGGTETDLGCGSAVGPILDALAHGERADARRGAERLVGLLRQVVDEWEGPDGAPPAGAEGAPIDHIEVREARETVKRALRACRRGLTPGAWQVLGLSVRRFAETLERHFAWEESQDLLRPEAEARPEQSPVIERLQTEHRILREEARQVARLLHHDPSPALLREARLGLGWLFRRLRRHERAENALTMDLVLRDDGGGD